jgi:hypothetical protein
MVPFEFKYTNAFIRTSIMNDLLNVEISYEGIVIATGVRKTRTSYNYHNSGYYPSSCLLFKTHRFGEWIRLRRQRLSLSNGPK